MGMRWHIRVSVASQANIMLMAATVSMTPIIVGMRAATTDSYITNINRHLAYVGVMTGSSGNADLDFVAVNMHIASTRSCNLKVGVSTVRCHLASN